MADVELTSDYPPDECADRIRAAIDRDGFPSLFGVFADRPVIGRVSGRSVRLRKRIDHLNSFQTVLEGTLSVRGSGTVFRGTAGIPPQGCAALAVLLGALALVCLGIPGFVLAGEVPPSRLAIIPLALVVAAGLVWLVRHQAHAEGRFLIEFVARAIGSDRVIPRAAAPPSTPLPGPSA